MQTGRSVQFQQVESVINAYELRAVPAFSIYQGKQLLHKYEGQSIEEGADQLAQFLPMLNNSAAIYTLCVYEEFTGRINDKSPYHGSWNFKFNDNTQGYNQGSQVLQGLQLQLQEMNEKISRLEVEKEIEDSSDPITGSMDRIGVVLSHPLVEKFLPMLLSVLQPPAAAELPAPASMAGIETGSAALSSQLTDALNAMLAATDAAEPALIKLGSIAKKDPAKFKGLLNYLKFI